MSCEHNKDALIEVVASGAAPQGELRVHLDECASCRAAFAEEQSLFAVIDSGLHASANAEVPSSLLSRLRVALDGAVIARPRWSSHWLAFAGAALAAACMFAVSIWHNHYRIPSSNTVAARPADEQVIPPRQTLLSSTPSASGVSVPRPQLSVRNSASFNEEVSSAPIPEVLVPRDQEVLLDRYVQELHQRKRGPLVAGNADSTTLVPLQIAPIQINGLDVKFMKEGESK